jgi:peroxiredoxin
MVSGFRPTLLLFALICCASPALSAQDSGSESFPSKEKASQASAEEIAARDAWTGLQESVAPPTDRSRAAFEAFLGRLAAAYQAFSTEYAGTAAAFEARHELALMEIHALRKVDVGLARMESILAESAKWKGPAPEGLRLDLPNYVFVVALAYADLERFEPAEKLLAPLASIDGPRGEQASRLLKRVQARKQLQLGMTMPAFEGPRLDGTGPIRLRDLRGKVVLVQFWATWSQPCTQEMTRLAGLKAELNNPDFQVLGVTLDDDRREGRVRAQSYLKSIGLDAPQIYEGLGWEGSVVQKFAVRAIPSNFLLDAEGVIRGRNLRGAELKTAISALLK